MGDPYRRKSFRIFKVYSKRSKAVYTSKIDQISIKTPTNKSMKPAPNRPKSALERKMSRTSSWEPSWRRLGSVLEASWACLRAQHSPKLATQIEGKSIKHQCKNRSKNRCLLSSSFDAILIGFWRENGSMLAPKSNQKSMSTSKGRFCKKYRNTIDVSISFQV